MEWILDNLQLVIAAIIIVGYVLRGMRKARDEAPPPPHQPPQTQEEQDFEEAERTRRIQEEIRRRILERRTGAPPAEPPPVIVFEREEEERPVFRPPVVSAPAPPPIPERVEPDPELVATLERQRALESQMQALRTARAVATKSAREVRQPLAAFAPAPRAWRGLGELRRDLSDPFALRRAILLKEILSEPVGLRPGPPELPRR